MKIKTEELRAAFTAVDNIAVNPVLESSQYVRVRQEGDKLTLALTGSSWSEASVKGATGGGKWTEYADRRMMKAFMASCSGPEVEVLYKPKEKLTFKAGQRLEVASHAPVPGYESWLPKAAAALSAEHRSALTAAVKYLPLNMAGAENMAGVWFGKDMMIATDSISLLGFYGLASKAEYVMPADVAMLASSSDAKVAADKDGAAAVLPGGYVYQPRSAQLDSYPHAASKAMLDVALKSKAQVTLAAPELLDALRIASQFIFDKNEAACIESASSGGLLITVTMATGVFQRTVKASGRLDAPVDVAVKRIMPWLEFAGSAQVEYAHMELQVAGGAQTCSTFKFTDGGRINVLLTSDI